MPPVHRGKNLFDNGLNIFPLSAFKPNRLEVGKKKKSSRTEIAAEKKWGCRKIKLVRNPFFYSFLSVEILLEPLAFESEITP